ncbi:MAG: DUF3108 domain-containing protein [Pseudoxanthomonas sp.]
MPPTSAVPAPGAPAQPAASDAADAPAAAEPAFAPQPVAPFKASYEAWYKGKLAGSAILQVVKGEGDLWRLDLQITAEHGVVSLLRLNIQQSTVFQVLDGERYRPLSQSTVRKALFGGKAMTAVYDWNAHSARWQGDIKKQRREPVPLQDGDLSSLLLDLAIMRDATPGKVLTYRVVDNGRARQYQYAVSAQTEIVPVGELSYDALRVARSNGNDEQIFWVASGVPTPVRILQRNDGEDAVDLRLIDYQGVQ